MENKEVTASRCLKNPKDYYNDVTVKKNDCKCFSGKTQEKTNVGKGEIVFDNTNLVNLLRNHYVKTVRNTERNNYTF